MQRRAAVLELAHLSVHQPTVGLDQLTNEIGAANGNGRENGGRGPAREQEIDDIPMHLSEAGRPADDIHLVLVACAVDVGAGVHEAFGDIETTFE